jgi:hypothetical protein
LADDFGLGEEFFGLEIMILNSDRNQEKS